MKALMNYSLTIGINGLHVVPMCDLVLMMYSRLEMGLLMLASNGNYREIVLIRGD